MRPADLAAVESARIRASQRGYRGILPDDYLEALRTPDPAGGKQEWKEPTPPDRDAVAVLDGRVIGFTAVARWLGPAGGGSLDAIFVDPDHWGRGIGGRLLADATTYLTTQGLIPIRLWVLAGNRRARGFYEARGFHRDELTRPYRREHNGHTAEAPAVRYTLQAGPATLHGQANQLTGP